MKNSKIIMWAVVDSLGIVAYVSLLAFLVFNGESIFGKVNNFAGPVLFLLTFLVSAVTTGGLFLGRPIWLYFEGMKKEAIKMFFYTLVCLVIILMVVLGLAISYRSNASDSPLNITYKVQGKDFTLVNGKAEKEIAPGSASKEVVQVFGEPVYGDLNDDGVNDAVMYLTQTTGGSGTFFYVVEAINKNGVYKGTEAMFLGDRIAPQNINIMEGRAVVNFAERKAGESFAVQPSVGKSIWVNLDEKRMQIGELVKDFVD